MIAPALRRETVKKSDATSRIDLDNAAEALAGDSFMFQQHQGGFMIAPALRRETVKKSDATSRIDLDNEALAGDSFMFQQHRGFHDRPCTPSRNCKKIRREPSRLLTMQIAMTAVSKAAL